MSNTFVFMGCIEWELCIKRKGSEGSEGKVDGDFGPEGYGRLSAAGCVEGGRRLFEPRVVDCPATRLGREGS